MVTLKMRLPSTLSSGSRALVRYQKRIKILTNFRPEKHETDTINTAQVITAADANYTHIKDFKKKVSVHLVFFLETKVEINEIEMEMCEIAG